MLAKFDDCSSPVANDQDDSVPLSNPSKPSSYFSCIRIATMPPLLPSSNPANSKHFGESPFQSTQSQVQTYLAMIPISLAYTVSFSSINYTNYTTKAHWTCLFGHSHENHLFLLSNSVDSTLASWIMSRDRAKSNTATVIITNQLMHFTEKSSHPITSLFSF